MDLFWLKELVHTQENEKKKLYATILIEKEPNPKDPYKISKDSPADQRKPAADKPILTAVSFRNCEQKGLSRQPQ